MGGKRSGAAKVKIDVVVSVALLASTCSMHHGLHSVTCLGLTGDIALSYDSLVIRCRPGALVA